MLPIEVLFINAIVLTILLLVLIIVLYRIDKKSIFKAQRKSKEYIKKIKEQISKADSLV